MDAAVPVDAKNAPTGTWKTAQHAVSHSAHTRHCFRRDEEQNRRRQLALHTKFRTFPLCMAPSLEDGIGVAVNIFMIARRFEDLEAWQLANEVKQRVYALLDISKARKDRKFCEQITESAASAPANLSEGFGYYRHPEFARHTRVAKSSLMETQNHLADGVDRKYWTRAQARSIHELADRAIGKCVRLLAHLETTDAPGTTNPRKKRTGTTFPKRKA